MWGIDEATARIAAWSTFVLGLLATLWKIVLRGRSELRADAAGEATRDGYSAVVDQLTQHVDRLDGVIKRMGEQLNDEMTRRAKAEAAADELRIRVAHLERELRALKGDAGGDF